MYAFSCNKTIYIDSTLLFRYIFVEEKTEVYNMSLTILFSNCMYKPHKLKKKLMSLYFIVNFLKFRFS